MFFCHLLIFFKINFFRKIISEILSECQTDWTQIRPDIISGLIWVQTVCKRYQQMILGDKELKYNIYIIIENVQSKKMHVQAAKQC